eukprot:1960873-Lingulodinium_polyedra.AAC.1
MGVAAAPPSSPALASWRPSSSLTVSCWSVVPSCPGLRPWTLQGCRLRSASVLPCALPCAALCSFASM